MWFENHYTCPECQESWIDEWYCQCDDTCPKCELGDITPMESKEIGIIKLVNELIENSDGQIINNDNESQCLIILNGDYNSFLHALANVINNQTFSVDDITNYMNNNFNFNNCGKTIEVYWI